MGWVNIDQLLVNNTDMTRLQRQSSFYGVVCVCMHVQAIDRGLVFEVSYSAAIRDSTMRRYTIANANALIDTCKGKVRCFYPSRLPVAVTEYDVTSLSVVVWHHMLKEPETPAVTLLFLPFRMWSCPAQLRRSVRSLLTLSSLHWSVINNTVPPGFGAQRTLWHHQLVSFCLCT